MCEGHDADGVCSRGMHLGRNRMADICQPFDIAVPAAPLFYPKQVAIVSNGRYGL